MPFSKNASALCALVLFGFVISPGIAAELRYRAEPKQQFAYEYKVEVKHPSEKQLYQGVVWYETMAAEKDLTFISLCSLSHIQIPRVMPDRASRFDKSFKHEGPTRLHIPSRKDFRRRAGGMSHERRLLMIAPSGKKIVIQEDRRLPYFYFCLEDFPFELLPEKEQESWSHDGSREMVINSSKDPLYAYYFSPGSGHGEQVVTVDETISFRLQKTVGDLSVYRKTHELRFPKMKSDIAIRGGGTWKFNRKLGLPESLDFTYKVTIKNGKAKTTFPVIVKYVRISEEEIETLDKAIEEDRQMERRKEEEKRRQWQDDKKSRRGRD